MLKLSRVGGARRAGLGLAAGTAALLLGGVGVAQTLATGAVKGPTFPAGVIPPPLSAPAARQLLADPAAFNRLLAALPRATADEGAAPPPSRGGPGSWEIVRPAPSGGLSNPLLLTDGTVIVHVGNSPTWYRLTPDAKGNYASGTWSQIAPMPVIGGAQYAPLYFASAVLPDGRVITMGGEYDGTNHGVWTNQGAIYDPVANSWTPVPPPLRKGWDQIGDAQSVVLASGEFMLASCCAYPDRDAILNPVSLTWRPAAAPSAGINYQDEQGYELLPYGDVLTIDIWTNLFNHGNANNAERYSPATNRWGFAGDTPVSLPDPYACGNFEIGPAVVRGDGRVVAFGGNTGCVSGATTDPTALYIVPRNAWIAGPNIPAVCGSDGATSCDLADAPAALEPDGSILFAASAGYGGHPTHFFEFGLKNTIGQVADTKLHAANSGGYYYNFLVLPNGQIFATDFSREAEVWTPSGAPVAAWAPSIGSVSTNLIRGRTYALSGRQLNGRSGGASYGDNSQAWTNYPIIKLVNFATGDVTYARSFDFSGMSIAPGAAGSTKFVVPTGAESGPSSLYVVANGIASRALSVTVR